MSKGDDFDARLQDIERSKQQRQAKDHDKRQRQEDAERKSLQAAGALAVEDWDLFDLKQTMQRAEIRVKEGRGSPMDVWYSNMAESTALVADCADPSKTLKRFSVKDLEAALVEVAIWMRLQSQRDFWAAMQKLMHNEIAEAKEERANVGRLHEAVSDEVHELLGGKTFKELSELEAEINQTLGTGEGDVDYWEMLLKHLTTYKLRARASEIYKRALTLKMSKLPAAEQHYMRQQMQEIEEALATARHAGLDKTEATKAAPEASEDGLSSNAKAQIEQLQRESEVLKARSAALVAPTRVLAGKESIHTALELYEQEASRPMKGNEEPFNQEVPMPAPAPGRKKPLFFNRINMGFEWNKYNQMHYDQDNPPPKVVQGYKFNIFYPELTDKSKTPTYVLQPENSDNQIIIFKAGEPYADVAFRIVNRDWDKAQREGYRSSFERGVLHLWFPLKRFRYRR